MDYRTTLTRDITLEGHIVNYSLWASDDCSTHSASHLFSSEIDADAFFHDIRMCYPPITSYLATTANKTTSLTFEGGAYIVRFEAGKYVGLKGFQCFSEANRFAMSFYSAR